MCSLSELVIRASHADRFYLLFLRFPSCLRRSCEFFTEYLSGVETETDTFCSCLLFRVEWQSVGDEDISQTPDCRGENRRFRTRWGGCRPPRCWGGQDHLKIPLRPHPNYGPIFNPPSLSLHHCSRQQHHQQHTERFPSLSLSPWNVFFFFLGYYFYLFSTLACALQCNSRSCFHSQHFGEKRKQEGDQENNAIYIGI